MIKRDGLEVRAAPRAALTALEVWGDGDAVQGRWGVPLPGPCRSKGEGHVRALWWEPGLWIVKSAPDRAEDVLERLRLALGDDGALIDISAAWRRLTLFGPLWRELLMIGGVFDAEDPTFAPGAVVGTLIHHVGVRIEVISETTAEVYVPPSRQDMLLDHWRAAAPRLGAG